MRIQVFTFLGAFNLELYMAELRSKGYCETGRQS